MTSNMETSIYSLTNMTDRGLLDSNGTTPNDIPGQRGLNFDHDPLSAVAIIEGITLVVIFVSALFANMMAMATIVTDKNLRKNSHNVLILNLIAMDLGVTTASMTFSIWSIYDHGSLLIHNKVLCMINGVCVAMFTFGNFTTILAISVDRYLTVCWSTRFPPTKRRAIVFVVFCWAVPIISVIPPSFESLSAFRFNPLTHHCSPVWDECVYFIIWFTFVYGITVPVMAFCYVSVMVMIRRQEHKLKSHRGALRGKKSNALLAGTTSDSGVCNISMDSIGVSRKVNFTDDQSDDPSVGQSDIHITGVAISSANIDSKASTDDASNQASTLNKSHTFTSASEAVMDASDAEDVVSEQRTGHTAVRSDKLTGKTANIAKSIWDKKRRAKNVLGRLNKLSVDKQIAMTGIILVLTTLICWTPYCIIQSPNQLSCFIHIDPPHWLGVVSMWLGYTNSLLDPLVYAFMNQRLRARYRSLIGCRVNCARYNIDF